MKSNTSNCRLFFFFFLNFAVIPKICNKSEIESSSSVAVPCKTPELNYVADYI